MKQDKRQATRLNVDYNAQIMIGAKGRPASVAQVLDISSIGAKIETSCLFATGDTISLLLYPDEKKTFSIKAGIIWTKETLVAGLYHYGLRFEGFGFLQKSRWLRHIKESIQKDMHDSAVEKRKHPRLTVDKPAVYILRNGISEDFKGYIANISISGMNFLSRLDLAMGQEVSFGFPFTKDIYFNVLGSIVRRERINEGFSYGVMFDLESDRTKPQLIALYIRERKI